MDRVGQGRAPRIERTGCPALRLAVNFRSTRPDIERMIMNALTQGAGRMYELLFLLGFLGLWLALQLWILPRMGIQT